MINESQVMFRNPLLHFPFILREMQEAPELEAYPFEWLIKCCFHSGNISAIVLPGKSDRGHGSVNVEKHVLVVAKG